MPHKPYWLNPAPLAGSTRVLEQRRDEDGWRVRLADSLFYPESGGQRSDQGWLGERRVLEVRLEDGEAWHLLDGDSPAGEIPQKIDAERRRDHSEQHSGQHLLSAVCRALLGAETLAFHMGEESSTVELSLSALDDDGRRRIEERCAQLIAEDRPIDVLYPDAEEAARLSLRREVAPREDLRVVSIRGVDASACGGTHVASTGKIGALWLGGAERIRGRLRVEYVAGTRALAQASLGLTVLRRIAGSLSCGVEELPARIEGLLAQTRDLRSVTRQLRELQAAKEAADLAASAHWEPLGSSRLLTRDFPVCSLAELSDLGSRLCEEPGRVFLGSCEDGGRLRLHLQRSPGKGPHLGEILKDALTPLGGRGGGSPERAQGALEKPADLGALRAVLRQRLLEAPREGV